MTRPRARPKPGRYYVHINGSGIAIDASTNRSSLEMFRAAADTIVECVPMPRVRVVDGAVVVNGRTIATVGDAYAELVARDLRRALRGK